MEDKNYLERCYKELLEITEVSRETFEKCVDYINLLLKWNKKINLVSKKHENFEDIWERHFIDSAQLLKYIPRETKIITDFGSGGGFPGIVIAILGNYQLHLIESDIRKCAFLNEAARLVKKDIQVHNKRIENINSWQSDVLTARALASVDKLLNLTKDFHGKSKICLFLKGQNVVEELKEAQANWSFDYNMHHSHSSSDGRILEITNLK
ncbi:MAG: 16S rRNA (guanine(527)-N(7))-methyltransferase RsmG [Rickettsiales bacterium]|nr:16S rRNA (guanine(527)-N(7))-methyltransferase RsmG [Pseudomonadota bacterium]MDA0965780.1 16S rRNA (guanine(527)-N(7))-methyltransferase RsmG [Pseudomonadota bacterium]MDG4543758.1 16S rRNA (guanine(527)-N(7))-methyltransferase RsmG [Rickettsiales bacterium]MDG4545905.1 16S rRNA (guanine(527)-N(7))-methyltransferase RsmG [Rickettsiales bacterium]MDG4548151.1 16S rRNA (guanine(527)-N(7))-methyltransferase RsmG [Rickettsiales bacterium]